MPHTIRGALLLSLLLSSPAGRGDESPSVLGRTGKLRLHAPSDRAFQLFTPEGEKAWAGHGWNPRVVCSRTGADGEGMVFHNGADEAFWLVTRLDAVSHTIEYAIVSEDMWTTLRCEIAPAGEQESVATVRYRWISRSAAGKEAAVQHDRHFPAMLEDWERRMNAVLDREKRVEK